MPEPGGRDPVDVIPPSAVDDKLIEHRHGLHFQPAQEWAVNREFHRCIALFAVCRLAPQCENRGLPVARIGGRVPEGPCSGMPWRRPRHNRTPPRGGQRVMRHFLPAAPIHRRPAPPAFAIAPLALSMLVTAPAAVLVALPGMALRSPARPIAAAP